MSNWTHVAGVIRIDDIRIGNTTPDFDKIILKGDELDTIQIYGRVVTVIRRF